MPKLIIIGAGCSAIYEEGESAVPGLKCPVDSNFFKMAKKVITHSYTGVLDQLLSGIINDIWRIYGHVLRDEKTMWQPFSEENLSILDIDGLGLENVLTNLSLENDLFIRAAQFFGYPTQLSFGIDSLAPLKELIALTISEALRGPICSKHKKIVEGFKEGDVILSFNYDILMDRALRDAKKFNDSGYLIPFQKIFSNGIWTPSNEINSPIKLLKMHGSLNFVRCSSCFSSLLLRDEKIGDWYSTYPKICPVCKREGDVYMQRLLVPPILTKKYTDPTINFLWSEAFRLRNVEEILIIGYSLPPTDFAAEALLRLSFPFGRHQRVPVTVVDLKEEVANRFKRIFNPANVRWKGSIDEYLDSP
jgi:hypothetical protein